MGKEIGLCIVGFGSAGVGFCKMLNDHIDEVEKLTGYEVKVTAIATRSKGSLMNKKGIDLLEALDEVETMGQFKEENPDRTQWSTLELINRSGADVLIELSTLSINDGEPAITHIKTAFDNNMDVITANKGPIAWDFNGLEKMASDQGVKFLYETTVMDGTPIFNLVKYALPGCEVKSFKGILNSTTNFILEEMDKGNSYEEALKEAQRRGFAEANPSLDVDGWDAAAKTTALINVLMDGNLTPLEIDRIGIGDIKKEEIQEANQKGFKIKLICQGYSDAGKIVGKVTPTLVKKEDIFSTIDSTSSILSITTDLMGEIIIVEKNPEIEQTAYGIYSDLLNLLSKK